MVGPTPRGGIFLANSCIAPFVTRQVLVGPLPPGEVFVMPRNQIWPINKRNRRTFSRSVFCRCGEKLLDGNFRRPEWGTRIGLQNKGNYWLCHQGHVRGWCRCPEDILLPTGLSFSQDVHGFSFFLYIGVDGKMIYSMISGVQDEERMHIGQWKLLFCVRVWLRRWDVFDNGDGFDIISLWAQLIVYWWWWGRSSERITLWWAHWTVEISSFSLEKSGPDPWGPQLSITYK